MSQTTQLLEHVHSGPIAAGQIDRERGVIKGVKLLGERSRNAPPNDHEYPRSTREAAIKLFENVSVYVDHPPRQGQQGRSVRERMGFVKNVKERGDGLYGDWHFPPRHALAEDTFWAAENNPNGVGFSINGDASGKRRENGRTLVEGIARLNSVDLVDRPATTGGLFESEATVSKVKVKDLIESLKSTRPGYARGLREMAESGVMDPAASMDEPAPMAQGAEPEEGPDHEQALRDGFRAAVIACLDDESMDLKAKLKKMKEILQMEEKLLSKDKGGAPVEGPPAVEESLKRENLALRKLAAKGVQLTPLIERAIKGCSTEAEITELVESVAPAVRPGARSAAPAKPGAGAGLREGQSGSGRDAAPIPTGGKELGKWLTSN